MPAIDCPFPAHEAPAILSRLVTQDWLAGRARESARSSYFRRKCGELSAPQQVYGQHTTHRICLCCHATGCRSAAPTPHEHTGLILHDREQPIAQPIAADAGRGKFRSFAPSRHRIELVRTTVLGEAGAAMRHVYFPHDGTVSLTVGLSEAQTIEVAMLGRDGIIGGGAAIAGRGATGALAAACPGSVRQRNPAADAGDSGSDDGSAAQRHFAGRTRAATCRHHPLQPGPDRNHRSARAGATACDCYAAVKAHHARLLEARR